MISFLFYFSSAANFCYSENAAQDCNSEYTVISKEELKDLSNKIKDFNDIVIYFGSSMTDEQEPINLGDSNKNVEIRSTENNKNYPNVKIFLTNQKISFNGLSLTFSKHSETFNSINIKNCKVLNKDFVFSNKITTDAFSLTSLQENKLLFAEISDAISEFVFNGDSVNFKVENNTFKCKVSNFLFSTTSEAVDISVGKDGGLPEKSTFSFSCNDNTVVKFKGDWSSQTLFNFLFAKSAKVRIVNIPPTISLDLIKEMLLDIEVGKGGRSINKIVAYNKTEINIIGEGDFNATNVDLKGSGAIYAKKDGKGTAEDYIIKTEVVSCLENSNVSLQSLFVGSLFVHQGTTVYAGNGQYNTQKLFIMYYDLAHPSKIIAENQEMLQLGYYYSPVNDSQTEDITKYVGVPIDFYCAKQWHCDEYLRINAFIIDSEYQPFSTKSPASDDVSLTCTKKGEYTCGTMTITNPVPIEIRHNIVKHYEFTKTDLGAVIGVGVSTLTLIVVCIYLIYKFG